MTTTRNILVQAEAEHGLEHLWDERWYEDDMYIPLSDEIYDLDLEHNEWGFLQSCGIDLGLEREDDLDDDDGWDYREPQRKSSLIVPDGMIVWMECNHPGRVYISGQDCYDWSDYNGYAPYKISWDNAVALITEGEDGEPWNLEICKPLSAECVAEMAEGLARRGGEHGY